MTYPQFVHSRCKPGGEITREETIKANMDKLTKRYPVAYSDKDAQERKDKKV